MLDLLDAIGNQALAFKWRCLGGSGTVRQVGFMSTNRPAFNHEPALI